MSVALRLAARGMPVFPCRNEPTDKARDKTPLTPHGFYDASTDPDLIRFWFERRFPNALVGVPTGDRFVVVDADLQHEDARQWQAEHRFEPTRTHRTRSGGLHQLFKPNDLVRCSASKIGPHIDIRGKGGYIIWWPAHGFEVMHHNQLAELPEFILAALRPKPPKPIVAEPPGPITEKQAIKRLDGIIRTIANAREGERNHVAFWGGCRLAEMVAENVLARSDAIAIAVEAASRSGLPRNEALRTAQSAFENQFRGRQ